MANSLIARVEAANDADNRLDVLIEVALFKPDEHYRAIRANNAGTKVILTHTTDGREETCWAWDWTMAANKAATIEALRELEVAHG